jgi:hypothetical protein
MSEIDVDYGKGLFNLDRRDSHQREVSLIPKGVKMLALEGKLFFPHPRHVI